MSSPSIRVTNHPEKGRGPAVMRPTLNFRVPNDILERLMLESSNFGPSYGFVSVILN